MSMRRINILSEDIVGKISAGEVVDRPASVVKELVENSIDAGADGIEIEIHEAGRSLIRISDNGSGMSTEDAKIACRQHSTSKIASSEDLNNIGTLGFRGEALASIAAVSQMDLTTRSSEEEAGVYLYLEGGQLLKERPSGRAVGTTVEVRNLFFNVPARRKFLKKEASELSEIVNVTGRFILSYPGIEFKLVHGDRCLYHAFSNMGMNERVTLVLGGDVSDSMSEISYSDGMFDITGYVSRPSATRKDRRSQVFFVNGRYFRSRVMNEALHEAYRSMLERGRYPAAVLFLKTGPGEVDVNVHPTKLQVKFGDDKALKRTIIDAVRKGFAEGKDSEEAHLTEMPFQQAVEEPQQEALEGADGLQTEFDYGSSPGGSRAAFSPLVSFGETHGGVFQVGGCYIVQPGEDKISVTDQHAAHERILYEFFARAMDNRPLEVQSLLFPIRIDLSAQEAVIMEKIISDFSGIGFALEHFGDNSFLVQAVPVIIKDRDIKKVILDVLADISVCNLSKIDVADELVKLTACRAAIKDGDLLTPEEMLSLLSQLSACSLPFTCPHGRPVTFDITKDELEKRFRRK